MDPDSTFPPPPPWVTPGAPSGQVRMLSEELSNDRGIEDVPLWDPGVLLRSVPLPLGQELATPSPVTHLEEPSDCVGHAAVDEAGRRRIPGWRADETWGLRRET